MIASRLKRIYETALATGAVARFVIFGSFVSTKAQPNDIDVFLLMDDSFDASTLTGEAKVLFNHEAAQAHFGASVFWLRRLSALDGEQATIEHWQVKRDGTKRGIVEITLEGL
jgi:predicted nucleotidyltransferase